MIARPNLLLLVLWLCPWGFGADEPSPFGQVVIEWAAVDPSAAVGEGAWTLRLRSFGLPGQPFAVREEVLAPVDRIRSLRRQIPFAEGVDLLEVLVTDPATDRFELRLTPLAAPAADVVVSDFSLSWGGLSAQSDWLLNAPSSVAPTLWHLVRRFSPRPAEERSALWVRLYLEAVGVIPSPLGGGDATAWDGPLGGNIVELAIRADAIRWSLDREGMAPAVRLVSVLRHADAIERLVNRLTGRPLRATGRAAAPQDPEAGRAALARLADELADTIRVAGFQPADQPADRAPARLARAARALKDACRAAFGTLR